MKHTTKILFICHGNICRSTMAQYVMQHLVDEAGLSDSFFIDSAATTNEELGNGIHQGTRRVLDAHNIPYGNHKARKMKASEYNDFDLIIAMDEENLGGLARIMGRQVHWRDDPTVAIREVDVDNKIHMLLDYTDRPGDVADPWYTGNFDATWNDVWEGCNNLLAEFVKS